jgi:hypothetical protein
MVVKHNRDDGSTTYVRHPQTPCTANSWQQASNFHSTPKSNHQSTLSTSLNYNDSIKSLRHLSTLTSSRLRTSDEYVKVFQFGNTDKLSFSKLSSRQSAELEDELFSFLSNNKSNDERLVDPLLGRDVSKKGLDWIASVSVPTTTTFANEGDGDATNNESIVVNIRPPTLLHPELPIVASNLAQVVQDKVLSLISSQSRAGWSAWEGTSLSALKPRNIGVTIRITAKSTNPESANQHKQRVAPPTLKGPPASSPALKNVTHFLAVYSCKGGVGKSTIATNLAYQLSSMGGRVGLLDLDVYGPSLPLLVKPDDPTVRQSPPEVGAGMIEPIEHGGVKLMSLGYVSPTSGVPGSGPDGGAAVLR